MRILSLFDGISCGRLALERAAIPVEKYYASEIDKYAIQVTQKNRPDTIQVGDVTKLNYLELLDIDMVIGGSPCQDLSIAKQNREGLRGARSVPEATKKGYTEIDQGNCVDLTQMSSKTRRGRSMKDKSNCLTAGDCQFYQYMTPIRIGELDGLGKGQANRIYSIRGKSVCLNANGGGGGAKTGLYKVDLPDGDYIIRKLTPAECERLQTLPDRWTAGVSNTQRYKAIGNGWTVDVIAWIFSQIPIDNILAKSVEKQPK